MPLERPLLTPRLRLEPVTPVLAAAARAGQSTFVEALGADAPEDWCAASLRLVARSSPNGGPVRAIAIHREDGQVVGDVRFEPLPARRGLPAGEFEIGYGVARERRRQGYAVEAAGAVINWLFAQGAETIWAGCDAENAASARTLMRLGFLLDSTPGRTFWWVLTPDLRSPPRA